MRDAAAIIGGVSGHRDELGPFSEKGHRRRPEVRVINKYLVIMAFIRIGLKGIGALALLWGTVVLLGGFVSELKEDDFWVLTIIAFLQAAGLSDAMGGDRFAFFGQWVITLTSKILSWGDEHHHECTMLPMGRWMKRQLHILVLKAIHITWFIMFSPAAYFAVAGPVICVTLSAIRIAKQDYVCASGEAISANLKPALNLFYYLSLAHGAIYVMYMIIESAADEDFVEIVSRQHGFCHEVLDGYFHKTKQMCVNNPGSTESWNLITYGADLLDSQLPEDYASGGRVLTMLVDQDIPVPITQLLIRSPRQRIQKLIGTLAWRNPAEQEMRWLAARIVEHLAGDLNLTHFPGALECISSLFDTSCHNNADQEAHHWPFLIEHSKQSKRRSFVTHLLAHISPHQDKHGRVWKSPPRIIFSIFLDQICKRYCAPRNGGTLVQDSKQRGNGEGTDEDLILPALRILENLTYDEHNCTLIYNTKGLLSKIVAPVRSNKLVEDIKSNSAWAKIVDGSLKVVSRLMGSLGSTGKDMCSLIADDSDVVENLEAVLGMDMKSSSGIMKLQMRALEVLTQLALHDPATTSVTKTREKLVDRAVHIFLTTDWMEDYLKDEKRKINKPTRSQQNHLSRPSIETCMNDFINKLSGAEAKEKMHEQKHVEKKMKEAKETASWLKKKAGEALARLSSDSEVIKSFIGCNDDAVRRLTELLDSKIMTIKCKISTTETMEIEIDIGCRISAAIILKNLSNYVKEPTLRKVLEELLPIQAEGSSTTTPRCWECVTGCITANRNDIETPNDGAPDEPSALWSHIQQCGERRLQAELLSLVAAIRASGNVDFAVVLIPQSQQVALDDFVLRLKRMVEYNMYASPACLAIQKLTCEMVTGFLQDDRNIEVIDKHNIVGTLLEASKMMDGLESRMLFAGVDQDCHGVPLKPLSSVLAKNVEDLLTQRKHALGINIAPATVSALQP